jgi:uncharacterized protein YodC (DUF2158 family)
MGIKLILLFAGLFIGLAAACSSDSGGPTKTVDGAASSDDSSSSVPIPGFETCSGLVDLEHVQTIAGRTDIEIGQPNINSGAQAPSGSGIETMCIYEYVTPEIVIGGPAQLRESGPSMTLTGMSFESPASAKAHYETVLANVQGMGDAVSPGSEITEGVLGDESYMLIADAQRVGTIVGFVVGPYIIQFHTTLSDGQVPLVAPQGLVELGGTVRNLITSP